MIDLNYQNISNTLIQFIRESVYRNGYKKSVIGVSGGIDSAIILNLLHRALGCENVFALLMPYKLSSPENIKDARMLCKQYSIQHQIIDISSQIDTYFSNYPTDSKLLIGNKCARERMSILYDFSGRKKALVAGTSNKSEILIGYSTLHGDSAAAFLPIGDLYKTQVFKFAEFLKLPETIINKSPSADLWKNQTDEAEIGCSYQTLDETLHLLLVEHLSPSEMLTRGYEEEITRKIIKLILNSQFKRTMPPVAKLTTETIGLDYNYLMNWGK
jgi:NAD+ synthase